MNQLLILLFSMWSISSSAGTLINSRTNEYVDLNLDIDGKILTINSNSEYLGNRIVRLSRVKVSNDKQELYPWTVDLCNQAGHYCVNLFLTPIMPALLTIETVLLFYRIPKRIVQKQGRKDFEFLRKTIFSDEIFEVNNIKFKRLSRILKNAY